MTKSFKNKVHQISQQGQHVSGQLERGQADTPLAEHFREIEQDINSAPFSIVLVGLTTQARTAVLGWLYGKDFSVLSVNVTQQLGLVEITLRERGYTLERSNGERLEFDQLEPFMDALGKSDILSPHDGENWIDPVRLGINSPKGLQGLKVYMPESPAMILKNSGLLNRVISQANLLVVAAPLHYELTDQDQQAILEISQNMDGFWPLLTVDELEDDIHLPEMGWWQKHKLPTVQLPPQLLTTHVAANIPSILQNVNDPARQALFLYLQAQRITQASDAVDERFQQEMRQLQSRKNREQRKAKAGETNIKANSSQRHEWDIVRNSLSDELTRINKTIQEQGKKTLLADSKLMTQLDTVINKLQANDLNQESGYKSIKLTVKDSYLSDLKNNLKVLLKQQLKQELNTVAQGLKKQQQSTESQIKQLTQQPQIIALNAPNEQQLWDNLKQQLNVSLRYRGEMPKRGAMARLSDGRKAIMGMSMLSMVIGGTFKALWGVDFRSMIMMVAPVFFVCAIAYSYFIWPKEDAERLEKELEKVRDGLVSELKRLLNELQREKQTKIAESLDEEKKQTLKKIDELMRHSQNQQEQQSTQQREQAQKRSQQIDQQIKDLQSIERDITALKRQCEALERDGKQQLINLAATNQ